MAESHSSEQGGVPKAGRKGDPRMHRAVSARLEDPNISLFDALCAGGFEYPTDEDANFADSEGVTLSQRKNQLSRRLRFARKQQQNGDSGSVQSQPRPSSRRRKSGQPSKRQVQEMLDETALAGTKRALVSDESLEAQSDESNQRLAKFHPDFHHLVLPTARSMKVTKTAFEDNAHSFLGNVVSQPAPYADRTTSTSFPVPVQTGAPVPTVAHAQPPLQQVKNPVSSQPVSHSAVALNSLSHTASSLGVTLEQLAVTLQSSSNLARIIQCDDSCIKSRQEMALNLYKTEISSLYSKSMLLAGFTAKDAQEGSSKHLTFALAAWQAEGQRLQGMIGERSDCDEAPEEAKDSETTAVIATGVASEKKHDNAEQDHSNHHVHEHYPHGEAPNDPPHQSHAHAHAPNANNSNPKSHGRSSSSSQRRSHNNLCSLEGRHIHQLEGKCGHKAVLHQPIDGNAHIDFVVGDRIECYQGVKPLAPGGQNASITSVWPSKYSCEELVCRDKSCETVATNHRQLHHNHDHNHHTSASSTNNRTDNPDAGETNHQRHSHHQDILQHDPQQQACQMDHNPKILYKNDIDFGSAEWNTDFANDETLLGLFKLGDVGLSKDDDV